MRFLAWVLLLLVLLALANMILGVIGFLLGRVLGFVALLVIFVLLVRVLAPRSQV